MRKPIIGITPQLGEDGRQFCQANYLNCVTQAGGIPLILPITEDEDQMRRYLEICDGIIFAGGPDIDPALYGEKTLPECGAICAPRDAFELKFLPMALEKPLLAICRGIQVLNVALGGTLYQDINSQLPIKALHRMPAPTDDTCHAVTVSEGTILGELATEKTYAVNSFHHQAAKDVASGLVVSARSEDGVIEGLEMPSAPFVVGVQWHPERLVGHDQNAKALLRRFVREAEKGR